MTSGLAPARASLTGDAVVTLGSHVASLVVALVLSVTVARFLGPGGAGALQILQATGNQVSLVASLGIAVSVVRYAATGRSPRALLGASMFLSLALMIPLALLAPLFVRLSRLLLDGTGPSWLLVLALGLGWVFLIQDLVLALRRGLGDHLAASLFLFVGRLIVAGTTIGAIVIWHRSLTAAVLGFVAANAIFSGLLLVHSLQSFGVTFGSGLHLVKELLRFNLRGHVGTVFQEVSYRTDLFLVAGLLGTSAAGVYGTAAMLATLLWYIPNSIGTVLLAAAGRHDRSNRQVVRVTRTTMAIMSVLGVIAVPTSFAVIPLMFGSEFRGAIVPFLVLLPGAVMLSAWKVLANAASGLGHPRMKLPSAVFGAVIVVALDLLLIPRAELVGAALASSIGYSATTLAILPPVAKLLNVPALSLLVPDVPAAIQVFRAWLAGSSPGGGTGWVEE